MARPVFDALLPLADRLYRGVSSPTDREIFRLVGVGPVWWIARSIQRDPELRLSDPALNAVRSNLERCGPLGRATPAIAGAGARAALEASFLTSAEIDANHLGSAEHVYWEEPIQSPSAARYLESTTRDPKIAILYAYGINIDSAMGAGPIEFFRGRPNDTPGVALLDAGAPTDLATLYPAAPHAAVVRGRVQRDSEVLIHGRVVRVTTPIVDLPAFNVATPDTALDAAATALLTGRVAR
jgi:hypothetical protein